MNKLLIFLSAFLIMLVPFQEIRAEGGDDQTPINNSIESGHQAGYPVYRGETLTAIPGSSISNISFNLYASCIDCPGNLQVGIAFDTPTPNSYTYFSFGGGNTCQLSLPNATVPDGTRRRVYVRIFDL